MGNTHHRRGYNDSREGQKGHGLLQATEKSGNVK